LHQTVPPALLARFDYRAADFFDHSRLRVNDRPRCNQWNEARGAQFGEFLDQEIGPVALGKRRGDDEWEWKFAIHHLWVRESEHNAPLAHTYNFSGVFSAVAVEQDDPVAGFEATHGRQVVRFRSGQDVIARTELIGGEEAIGQRNLCRIGVMVALRCVRGRLALKVLP
jgi:hypothetical protein